MSHRERVTPVRLLLLALIALFGLAIAFAGGYYLGALQPHTQATRQTLLHEVQSLLRDHYVTELPANAAVPEDMVEGLLASLDDPDTTYLPPADHELEIHSLEGRYGGIGAYLAATDHSYTLVPYAGSPADRAGLQPGDVLLEIDGVQVSSDLSVGEVLASLRGTPGSMVRVAVSREGVEGPMTFEVEREQIALPSVSSRLHPQQPRIGILTLRTFGRGSVSELRQAVDGLQSEGAEAVALDLRGNPGGLIDAAVEIADLFLSEGVIMTEVERDGTRRVYEAQADAADLTLPMVVLVDGSTASAAEVVAGALQYHRRATVLGQRTYGKGSVQEIYPLSNGASLHVTSAHWYAPDGSQLDGQGVTPDVPLRETRSGEDDPVLTTAAAFLLEELKDER